MKMIDPLAWRVWSYARKWNMLDGLVLCAVSGGRDSMVMLHLLSALGAEGSFRIAAAHFNHRLRPAADRDEAFVRDWCREQGIPLTCGAGDARGFACREGLSVEDAARKLRYAFLESAARDMGADHIATAHHREDNAETVLLHLLRGTGLQGLGGIAPVRGAIVRPLLETSRAEIDAYAARNSVPYVEDESNRDTRFTRNRLRLEVLPLLEEISPGCTVRIAAAAELLREENEHLRREAEALAPEAAPAANMEAPKTAVKGTPIYAAGKGTIKETGFNTKDGNFVRIDHGSGQESFYAHCASVLVKTGDAVTSGQTIATIGSSGMSTGPHLHFKFLVNGVATDPLAFVAANDGKSQLNLFTASIGTFHEDADGEPSLEGNPIIALQDGTILAAGVKNYGPSDARKPYVQISYQSGYTMLFSRCKEVLVKTGDAVKAGDIIAYTGKSAGGTYPAPTEETESMLDAEARWKEWADENLVNGDYPRNSKGETYDSLIGCEYLGYEPDLIEVAGPELEGYVATKELHFPDFGAGTENCYKHAEESAAYRNWVEENQISRVVLPMYDEEHNVIGEWETGAVCGVPRGKTITYAELVEASKQGWPNANGSQEVYREPEFKTIEEAQEAVRNGWPEQ